MSQEDLGSNTCGVASATESTSHQSGFVCLFVLLFIYLVKLITDKQQQ